MATIIPGYPSAGYSFGAGLSSGLSQGLESLAARKTEDLKKKNQLASLLSGGFTPEEADFIMNNPSLAPSYVKSLSASALPQNMNQNGLGQLQGQSPQPEAAAANVKEQLSRPSVREQLANSEKNQLQQQKLENEKYQQVIKRNAPLRQKSSKGYSIGEEMLTVIDNMEKTLNQGGVRSGVSGQLLGGYFSEPSSTFDAESKKLASLRVQGQGVATNFKLKFAQQQKPSLDQPEGTQRALLEEARQEAYKLMAPQEAINAIIDANGGKEPDDLESLTYKYLKEQYPKDVSSASTKQKGFKSLPSVEEAKKKLKPGTVLLDKKTGTKYVWDGSGYTKKDKGK